jgi:hypothetical protein
MNMNDRGNRGVDEREGQVERFPRRRGNQTIGSVKHELNNVKY